ncbi:unnamed protein product [Clonostachys rosea]|uniref:Major facilitator superfamily (MFS) profile domain-containing protein n=1 Tax=Bionectria ochroleuca TaxID=29856 RepID=A0ABY6UQB6_BIOOC|nr:unnamed protein product [Clonostachys rosea]
MEMRSSHENGGVLHDSDLLGDKANVTHEEVVTLAALTEEERIIEKRVRRKVDFLILPTAVLVYILNYIDRNNYASARLQGLEEDLKLTDTQYQTGLSVFFVGYIIGQLPGNMILNWFGRPSIHIGFFTCAWGLGSGFIAMVGRFETLLACRLILGFVEAPFLPGIIFSLPKWYTKEELNLRMAIFFSGILLAGAFGNLIAAGILGGFLVFFVMPDFPETWKVLSAEERHVATRRLAIEAAEAGIDEDPSAMSQLKGLKLALTDVNTYLLGLAYLCVVGTAGLQYFFPTLTASLGYSKTISLLLCAPPYFFMTFFFYTLPVVIVGMVIFMTTNSFAPKYISLFLMLFIFSTTTSTFAWIASSIPRPPAKRAAAYALINSLANSSSVWTSFIYKGPTYTLAMGVNIGLTVAAGLCALALRFVLVKRNKESARFENQDYELTKKELRKLQRTAEVEGIDIAAARRLQQGFRYMI